MLMRLPDLHSSPSQRHMRNKSRFSVDFIGKNVGVPLQVVYEVA